MEHYITCFLALFFCISGCSRTPEELTGLSPVTITVVNGDTPIPGVRVLLNMEADSRIWSSTGVTNASGVAVISSTLRTHNKAGAKPGTYKVTLMQSITLPPELQPTEEETEAAIPNAPMQAKRTEYFAKNRVVPQAFEDITTTPIELTVIENTPAALTVDVAKR
ncbi:MAG: Ig-like domain-containing protein [Planctomycetaceae bacterium]|nr:Ig-like domain-containing protein [Planctomycetaceae bacterium]